jgi:hypothetical protein
VKVILLVVPFAVTVFVAEDQIAGGFRLVVSWRIKLGGVLGQVIVIGPEPPPLG